MTKMILLALLTLATATEASAQSRQFYDSAGKRIGSATTDSSGTTTNYDSRGRVISRETTTGNTTTIYDARGRNVGRFTVDFPGIDELEISEADRHRVIVRPFS